MSRGNDLFTESVFRTSITLRKLSEKRHFFKVEEDDFPEGNFKLY